MYYSPLLLPPKAQPVKPVGAHGRPPQTANMPPIQQIATRNLLTNAVFLVSFDHILDVKGNEVKDYLNVTPLHSHNGTTGVAILPVIGNQIALARIYRYPLGEWALEAPKGFVDHGETPDQAAIRELKEETGYAVLVDKMIKLGRAVPEGGVIKGTIGLYLAALGATSLCEQPHRDIGHDGELTFVDIADIHTYVVEGRITDAVTLALLYHYQLRSQPDCSR